MSVGIRRERSRWTWRSVLGRRRMTSSVSSVICLSLSDAGALLPRCQLGWRLVFSRETIVKPRMNRRLGYALLGFALFAADLMRPSLPQGVTLFQAVLVLVALAAACHFWFAE